MTVEHPHALSCKEPTLKPRPSPDTAAPTPSAPRAYGRFYWPLALSGFAILLEQQFQNGVLARYPRAEIELATFALASSSFQLINAMLGFIPQMVAVMARTPADRAQCARFATGAGVVFSLPLLLLGFTQVGAGLLTRWMNIPEELAPAVVRYLQWLAPLVWINAIRHYCTGILVLAERTQTVTLMNVLHLGVLVAVLLGGLKGGWGALRTVALATVLANLLHFSLGVLIVRRVTIPAHQMRRTSSVTLKGMLAFFWPLAITSMFFAMSRPVLYTYLNLTVGAAVALASLRVGFDFCSLFQNPINQFRHVYATYGAVDPKGVTRFMIKVTAFYLTLMALTVFTPLNRLVFGNLMGLEGDVLVHSLQVVRVLLLLPLLIMIRNLYHGKMMVRQKTAGMAVAALLRVGAMALGAHMLLLLGWLNHMTAAAILLVGFVAEIVMVRHATRQPESSKDQEY